ncbi:MAG TPA: hypothetical protein VFQ86_02310 [Arachidicoccus soli]|nr:hypothetical protein [Arachidicoccus soli]
MTRKPFIIFLILFFVGVFLPSCQKENPSILKVYVRASNNILKANASVRIVGDLSKNTPEYLKETKTNEQGVAVFNLEDLFDKYKKDEDKVAYFTVYAKDTSLYYTTGTARAKANITYTTTITLKQQ